MTQPDSLPDSLYAAHCRRICRWCGEGNKRFFMWVGPFGWWYHRITDPAYRIERCTAPTELDFAEQQARIAEIRYAEWLEMRKALEEAPHGFDCESNYRLSECAGNGKCDCWKSKFTKERTNG